MSAAARRTRAATPYPMVSGVPAALTSTGLGDGGYIVEPLLLGAKTVGVHVTFLADD